MGRRRLPQLCKQACRPDWKTGNHENHNSGNHDNHDNHNSGKNYEYIRE